MGLWTPIQAAKGQRTLLYLYLARLSNRLEAPLNQYNIQHIPLHRHLMHLNVPCHGAVFVSIY